MTDTVAPASALPSLFSRALGIITSPKATFEAVVRHPSAVGILFVVALLTGMSQSAFSLTERGRQAQIDFQVQQMERFGVTVTDEMYARLETQSRYAPYTAMVGALVVFPIIVLIISAIFYAIFNAVMGGTAEFKQIMAVTAHAWMVPAVGAIFAGALNFMRGSIQQSVANLGMLLPMLPEGSFAANLAGTIDLFQIWFVITLAMGLAVLYKRKTSGIAMGLFGLYAVIAVSAAYFLRKG